VADLGRLRPRSLRWRLTLALGSVLILAFLGTFYVVYHETDSRLRGQIDSALATEAKSFSSYISPPRERTAAAIARAAHSFLKVQPFSASARLLYAIVPGQAIQTNQAELLGVARDDTDDTPAMRREEARFSAALKRQAAGFSNRHAPDVGRLRLYVETIRTEDGLLARVGVGESLAPVEDALDGITRGFAIGGSLRASTPAISRRGSTTGAHATRPASWPTPSTTCSTGSRRPSRASRPSSRTPPTSCARR
jgi:hypothetical protein